MEVNIERIGSYTIEEIRTLYLQQDFGLQLFGDDWFLIKDIVRISILEEAPVAKTVVDFLGPDRLKELAKESAIAVARERFNENHPPCIDGFALPLSLCVASDPVYEREWLYANVADFEYHCKNAAATLQVALLRAKGNREASLRDIIDADEDDE